jgi:DMSO/TMAO reductase YedYZ molybdopterin-dependent catalytic subunit
MMGILSFSGCVQQDLQLDAVEVTEYQGEKLSSVYDFRENSIKGPQYVSKENYSLTIKGLVDPELTLDYDSILSKLTTYKKVVTLHCVEGWSVTILWDGVLVKDLLNLTNASTDAKVVIFHALDGYTTSLPIDYILENDILLAYKMNNVTLPAERGFPFQLVAESKWGYKWIKWVSEIGVSEKTYYEGYWEQRGFSNTANVNESFFD